MVPVNAMAGTKRHSRSRYTQYSRLLKKAVVPVSMESNKIRRRAGQFNCLSSGAYQYYRGIHGAICRGESS